ncbi:MFS general substrate transporter [Myxozyma melibiosi]|uniref:MFS general substrate transporter n=1 Tax=Myxozyma melibiosi TaxID=54550 RepID=A0ABR1EXW2_9ASCO
MEDQDHTKTAGVAVIQRTTTESTLQTEKAAAITFQEALPAPDEHAPNGGLTAWLQVSGSFVLFMNSWGTINSYGVFETYYVSINLSNKSSSDIAWIGSTQAFLLLVVGIISGPVFDLGVFRPLLISGSVVLVLGLVFTSLCHEYWQFMLAQGIMTGIGCGLFFVPSVAVIPQYFTTRRSFALGIAASGSSVGGVIYPIIFHKLRPLLGFGWAVRVVALIVLVTQGYVLAVMRVRTRPAGKKIRLTRELVMYPPFLAFIGFGVFAFMGAYIPFYYMEGFSILKGIYSFDVSFYMLSVLNGASTFGRLLPNILADRVGPFNVLLPCIFAASIVAFCWVAAATKPGVVAISVLYGFFSGSIISLAAPCLAVITPDISVLGTRIGILFAVASVGLLIGTPVAGELLKTGMEFKAVAVFCGGTLAVACGFVGVARGLLRGWRV